MDVDHEGKGYVSEAVIGSLRFIFENLRARRVRLECDDTNLRCMRVAERCGFIREAHFRENKLNPNGTISGTMVYGLLRIHAVQLIFNQLEEVKVSRDLPIWRANDLQLMASI